MTANPEEVLNLVIVLLFFFYLVKFVSFEKKPTTTYWYFAIIALILSKVFTVAESFVLYNLFNYLEHIFITLAAALFLISIAKKQL